MSDVVQTSMFSWRDAADPSTIQLTLVSVTGPHPVSITLDPAVACTIGRRSSHVLPLEHPEVSKDHAALTFRSDRGRGGWFLADTGSRHGTRLNGVRLEPHRECPIAPGDLIEISPWTFCLMNRSAPDGHTARISTVDDAAKSGSTVTSIQVDAGRELAHERLRLLLHFAESLQRAADQHALAEITLDAAIAGTGYANAAVLRPMTPDGEIELILSRGEIHAANATPRLSRSLIRNASAGMPVQLTNTSPMLQQAVSIAELGIQQAICIPLMIESTVAGFLYLDARGRRARAAIAADEAAAFAIGVGRLASMAWANLMRLELEKRYARIEGELQAGARAQQLILPSRVGRCLDLSYIGECKPGRVVSGDFFDIFPLNDRRVALTIGDVTGKGVPASVIMTTTQGFLHGALRRHGDLQRAMLDLNAYIHQRCESRTFITLWAGVFDLDQQRLEYVDAGHGYAWMIDARGSLAPLTEHGGPPIAVAAETDFQAGVIAMPQQARILLVSDGIVEQPAVTAAGGRDDLFGTQRVESCLKAAPQADDLVAELFGAVYRHAGTQDLADDATVVVAGW